MSNQDLINNQINSPKKPKINLKDVFAKLVFIVIIFTFGVWVGQNVLLPFGSGQPPIIRVLNKEAPNEIQVDFAPLWLVWDKLTTDYLERNKLDPQELLYGAISGLVKAVGDPYTVFLDPESNRNFELSLSGTYEGVGIELAVRDERLVVVAPIDGTPAAKAGVKAGDTILAIDGEDTFDVTIQEAVQKIRGERDTKVVLTIGRGKKTLDIAITRARIVLKSVEFADVGESTAHIKITRFGDNTASEWDETIGKFVSGGFTKMILDMRNNPGGRLDQAVTIAGDFVPKGSDILLEEDASGRQVPFKSDKEPRLKNVQVVILINRGSASASEIVAGALRDLRGVKIVGETSFGKGSVQRVDDLPDGSGLHITFAKWLTPKGIWVHDKGLKPDIEIKLTDEDQKNDRDPQLDKAKELLK